MHLVALPIPHSLTIPHSHTSQYPHTTPPLILHRPSYCIIPSYLTASIPQAPHSSQAPVFIPTYLTVLPYLVLHGTFLFHSPNLHAPYLTASLYPTALPFLTASTPQNSSPYTQTPPIPHRSFHILQTPIPHQAWTSGLKWQILTMLMTN